MSGWFDLGDGYSVATNGAIVAWSTDNGATYRGMTMETARSLTDISTERRNVWPGIDITTETVVTSFEWPDGTFVVLTEAMRMRLVQFLAPREAEQRPMTYLEGVP